MKDVSIIIPTYNRPDDLKCVLPFYLCQEDVLEIIIVDDGSTLSYSNVIEKFKDRYNVKIVYHKNDFNLGAAASRNIGVTIASGTYILWGEDDAFLASDYIHILKKKIQGKKQIVAGSIFYGIHPSMNDISKQLLINNQLKSERMLFDYDLLEGYYRLKTENDIVIPWIHALFLTNKDAYINVMYYEDYKVNGYREETDAQVQMTKNGYKIIYTSETCCYHFPSKNSRSGQHSSSIIKYELYKIINNNIFINRHYTFLKKNYNLNSTKFFLKTKFAMSVLNSLSVRITNKFLRFLNK